jgi:GT2 family glycosyltransferase
MDTLAPPVVAVVVAHDPGPWFEETLASLASQDYAELSVLILDAASEQDLTARVAAVLPTAYVRRFEENPGYGPTVNQVRAMVDGAAYFLLCHDDVALYPDTVHLMVEEAFRSNAGLVSPKVVSWDDPERLIHVGMTVDKGGSVVERVQPDEIDHGQHDAVRDVFVAPGGATLIRADLFEELDGFDPAIVAMGEDLDLCWRAQVAGARIIVAPDARIRHLEELAAGARAIEPSLTTPDGVPPADPPVTLQELQRRHELLAVFKCYGPYHLIRVVPQVFVLAVAEVVVAGLTGNRARARAVVRAWRWNLGRVPAIRRQRRQLKAHRRLGDKEIRLLQLGGSARLSAYGRRVFQDGLHGAHADELADAEQDRELTSVSATALAAAAATAPVPGAATATATAVPATEAVPVGSASVVGSMSPASARGRVSLRIRATAWVVAALVVIIGSRGVIGGRLPVVGQFVPFPGWSATLSQFVGGWHPSGVGTTAPASPALALAGVVGTVLLGAMGLTQKVLIFGCLPVGAWGAVRLVRPFGSQRASLVSGLAYLAMALPYNALALGRWGALMVYAGTPWVLGRLFRATGTAPYLRPVEEYPPPAEGPTGDPSDEGDPVDPVEVGADRSGGGGARQRLSAWTSRHATLRSMVALGLIEAVLVSFAPAAALVVVVAALAVGLAALAEGGWRSARDVLRLALGATLVAVLLCLPWVIGVLAAGRGAVAVFGVPIAASDAASWSSLLRFAVGPVGVSPLAWGFAAAALVPLVLARGPRFQWAVRLWAVALVFWLFAWLSGRGWTGSLAVDPLILLAPAAAAVASLIGLGIAAFEEDLRASEFGWRQLVVVVATGAVVIGSLPTLVSALPGRWDLPTNDFTQSVSWMRAKAATGSFRVLWLGDTRALNLGSWSAGDGLAYATSEDGPPDARWLWNGTSPGPASGLASAVDLARQSRTDQLGRMLAPAGVRYVVLLTSLAPEITGEQSPEEYPVPADLPPALGRQLDLTPVVTGTGITVYANTSWIPVRAAVAGRTVVADSATDPAPLAAPAGTAIVAGAQPVLPGGAAARSYHGTVPTGTVLSALAPAGRWTLTAADGRSAPRGSSFGWAGRYTVATRGPATLGFDGGVETPLALLATVVAWLLVVAFLLGRRLGGGTRRFRIGRRRHPELAPSPEDDRP